MAAMLVASLFASMVASAIMGGVPQVGGPAASPPPTPAHGAPAVGCQAVRRSSDIYVHCVQSGGLNPACCEAILEAARRGGLSCLCKVAAAPYMSTTCYTAPDVLDWYHQCGGTIPVDAYTARQCGLEAPPSSTKKKLPLSPSETSTSPMRARTMMCHSDYDSEKAHPTSKGTGQHTNSKENVAVDEAQPSNKTIVIKIEVRHVVVGVLIVVLVIGILALALYVKFAGPGPRRDKAQKFLDLLLTFMPPMMKEAVKEVQKEQEEANGTPGGTASGTAGSTEEIREEQDLYQPRGGRT